MSTIDTELATLRARIAQIEEAKKVPPPPKSLEMILNEKRREVENNKDRDWSKKGLVAGPVARACHFIAWEQVTMIESIVDSLNRIDSRLDALEKH
jgi:hypothetical protein